MIRKPVFTTFEAAKLCHVSPLSIINWVNAGRLPAFRTPGGHRRIRREDLIRFMRDNGMPLPDELRDGTGRVKVLIVDGEPGVRQLLAEHLSTRPTAYEVLTAGDGFEAGRLMATFRPDAVVLDLRMPGLDGFQICRAIKADPETSATAVIGLTAYPSLETETRFLECGATRCLSKPVDPSNLGGVLDSVFEQHAGRPRSGRRRRGGA